MNCDNEENAVEIDTDDSEGTWLYTYLVSK